MGKTTIYYFYWEEAGEIEAFFDEDMRVICSYYGNDANWSQKYFKPLMDWLGADIEILPDHFEERAMEVLAVHWKLDLDDIYGRN